MSGYISTERDGYFKKVAVTLRRDEARPDGWPMDGRRIEEIALLSKRTLRSKTFELEDAMSGYISTERDGYFKKVAVTLRRDEARPDRWPVVRPRIEEFAPYRSGTYDPKRSNSRTQCRATSRRSEMATLKK